MVQDDSIITLIIRLLNYKDYTDRGTVNRIMQVVVYSQ